MNIRYSLTDAEKAGVDGETYRYRKDSDGKYRTGHHSELVKDSSFGYPISFHAKGDAFSDNERNQKDSFLGKT